MICWVVENCFGEETKPLLEAIVSNGGCYEMFDGSYPHNCIIRGSVKFAMESCFKAAKPIVARYGVFNYSYYYRLFKNVLVNKNVFLVTKDMLEHTDLPWTKDEFGTERIFIKPNSGEKLFTGTTMCRKWLEKEIDIVLGNVHGFELLVVSSYKDIGPEFRGVIGPKGLISISSESNFGTALDKNFEEKILKFAESFTFPVLDKSFPFYTVDFCEHDGKIKLVEVNSFNSAGLYSIDYDLVVKEIHSYVLNSQKTCKNFG